MADLRDFEIFRITAEHVSSVAEARELVDIFKAATSDAFYDTLGDRLAEYFRDMIKSGSGGFQAARLKRGGKSHIVAIALFKLRFGGWRDPAWQFVATPEQKDLYESVFSVGNTKARSLVREAAGDPVITAFKDSLEASGKSFDELDEDLLVLEPIYILPQYQHVSGLAQELIRPVLERAVANNIRVIAYHRVQRHDYSSPGTVYPGFKPLYRDNRVVIHVNTRETPEWTGPEIVWDQQFQLYGTEYGPSRPYPREALMAWS